MAVEALRNTLITKHLSEEQVAESHKGAASDGAAHRTASEHESRPQGLLSAELFRASGCQVCAEEQLKEGKGKSGLPVRVTFLGHVGLWFNSFATELLTFNLASQVDLSAPCTSPPPARQHRLSAWFRSALRC